MLKNGGTKPIFATTAINWCILARSLLKNGVLLQVAKSYYGIMLEKKVKLEKKQKHILFLEIKRIKRL